MIRFDLADLNLLRLIEQTGSLSAAAAAVPVALSAASYRLRQLEGRLGLPLFARRPDGLEPTPAGRIALDHAQRVWLQAEQMQLALDQLAGQRRVALKLAANTVANSTFLPEALGPFLADFPAVTLQIEECASRDILSRLRNGELEIGVLDGNLDLDGLVSLPFRHDRLVLLVAQSHPLSARHHCSFADTLDCAYVGMPAERAMQRFIEDMALLCGKPLNVRVRAPGFDAIAQLVAQNAGAAILPLAAAQRLAQSLPLHLIELTERWATRELRVCVRDVGALDGHSRQLLDYLTREFRPGDGATAAATAAVSARRPG